MQFAIFIFIFTFPIVETATIDTSNTHIHDLSLFWLGTGTSIKSGGMFDIIQNAVTKQQKEHVFTSFSFIYVAGGIS
jgi:hypothetical protein